TLQTVPSTGAGIVLIATLRNATGVEQKDVTISYDFGELHAPGTTVVEEVWGHRVYWSLSGQPGTWNLMPSLSAGGPPGRRVATAQMQPGFDLFEPGGLLYVGWADDNSSAIRDFLATEEGGYTIDNITFTPGQGLGISLAGPGVARIDWDNLVGGLQRASA